MPGIAPPCARVECKHPEGVHLIEDIDPRVGPRATVCRVTGCQCLQFLEPEAEPEPPDPDAKRLVIEIPDGFAVHVQLVPVEVAS